MVPTGANRKATNLFLSTAGRFHTIFLIGADDFSARNVRRSRSLGLFDHDVDEIAKVFGINQAINQEFRTSAFRASHCYSGTGLPAAVACPVVRGQGHCRNLIEGNLLKSKTSPHTRYTSHV
jgi:hypothetical protein